MATVKKIPNENCVVVRAADNLKLVELESEHTAGMFNKGSDTQGTRRSSRVLGCVEVPDFNFTVVSS